MYLFPLLLLPLRRLDFWVLKGKRLAKPERAPVARTHQQAGPRVFLPVAQCVFGHRTKKNRAGPPLEDPVYCPQQTPISRARSFALPVAGTYASTYLKLRPLETQGKVACLSPKRKSASEELRSTFCKPIPRLRFGLKAERRFAARIPF